MSSQYVDGGLAQHQFDWETFDKQPVKIKEMTWYAVASDVHYPLVIPAALADAMAERGWRVLSERHAAMALQAYGPDYPMPSVGNYRVGRGYLSFSDDAAKPVRAEPVRRVKPERKPDRSFFDLEPAAEVKAPKASGLALDL